MPPRTWSQRLDALVRGLDRGGRHWTLARRKESFKRLHQRSGGDDLKLATRLDQLLVTWEADQPDTAGADPLADKPAAETALEPTSAVSASAEQIVAPEAAPCAAPAATDQTNAWPVIDALQTRLVAALPMDEEQAAALADTLAGLARRIADAGIADSTVAEVDAACRQARRLLGQRHHLVDELLALCRSLSDGLIDFADEPQWLQGQTESLRQQLVGPAGSRAVRGARELIDQARSRQCDLRVQRAQARDALKTTVQQVLTELGSLGELTGQFGQRVGVLSAAIEAADSLEGLAGVVRELLGESRSVRALVSAARVRLAAENARAAELQTRVLALEGELRRLSEEATTDALTQVANRRGLALVFEVERSRIARSGAGPDPAPPLAVGLIDIDNFKKLNDSLGHAAGDEALKALAARVKAWLRPIDHLARFGGEEFVVLLPGTALDEAQQALTRLQRQLTASLFMHNGQEVFVTFSAGVTAYRPGETVEAALERADEGLYEAKRTGKNRTCVA